MREITGHLRLPGVGDSAAASNRQIGETKMPPLGLEMVRLNEAVTAVNVESLMPPDWQHQVHEVVKASGKLVTLQGGAVSTSMETAGFTTVYTVVKGQDIERNLPWLWKLYQEPFRKLVSQVADHEVEVDPHKKFSANINTIHRDSQKDGYELHTDVNPWTGLLAVTTMHKGDGGELIHVLPDGTRRETSIQAGWLYIFDGRNHPHKVNLLNPEGSANIRITVPMDYIVRGEKVERPADLDAIFGK